MPIFKRTFSQELDLLEQHLTKDILSQTDCKTILTKLRTTFENAFNSEFKERMQKYTRFNAQSFQDAMICNMDSIGKYMLEIILHQQRTPQLLKQKKLMQTQEDHSNPIQALNVDSLKVDLVVIQNTCSEKEDSSSETASSNVKKSVAERTRHQIQYDRRVNKRQMQMQESKTDTGKAVNDDLDLTESNIRPIYDEEPMAEVHLTAECNIFAIGQQHTKKPKIINEGRVDLNKAKIKKEIDVLETMNIELEHSVANLNKENETLKKHYKDLYDSIKITRSKTIEQTTSLLANNAYLKAQIQEKVFAIVALKNNLRKLKGNSVDSKFAKTSVLGKPVLQSLRNQSVVRQPNAFKSEGPQMSKQRFASQVDVNNNSSRPVTQHYLPKRRESAFEKPDHINASSESRNSSKNMPRFSLNDMVHNHYLDEARKKTQERDRNSKTSVMSSARFQSTTDDSKPKPRSTNHSTRSLPVAKSSCVTITAVPKADQSKSSSSFSYSKHFVCSTCHKCLFYANHDACITKLLKEVNSRAKIQSHKTKNHNKLVDQKSHTQKPGRHIFIGHRFSPNKTSVMYEKTSPRSDLSEPTHGSNVDILNIHESKQTLDLSAGTSINVQKEQSLDLSACTLCNVNKENLRIKPRTLMSNDICTKWFKPRTTMSTKVHQAAETVTTSNELDFLFGPLFDEYFNGENQVVSKSSAVTTTDASNKRQQQPDSTSSTSTLATTVTANENFDF
ncbi:hypothetical protein Tco_0638509 [Tanacetum coccineum]